MHAGNGNKRENGKDHISLYLSVALNSGALSLGWEVYAIFLQFLLRSEERQVLKIITHNLFLSAFCQSFSIFHNYFYFFSYLRLQASFYLKYILISWSIFILSRPWEKKDGSIDWSLNEIFMNFSCLKLLRMLQMDTCGWYMCVQSRSIC